MESAMGRGSSFLTVGDAAHVLRTTLISAAAFLTALALAHAYFVEPLLFWPLASLALASAVLAAYSPLALSRRMTFLAHAQGHTVLTAALAAAIPAAALSVGLASPLYLLATLLFLALFNLAVIAAAKLGFREDVATGVVISLLLTATTALLFAVRSLYSTSVDPLAIITGEYVLVTRSDFVKQAPFLLMAAAFPSALGVKYLYSALDASFAKALGIKVELYDAAYLASMSLAVAATVYTMGSLMPAVLLVLPGAVAARLSPRLTDQIPLSISTALISASCAHFLYAALPWLWPNAALGAVLFVLLIATSLRPDGRLLTRRRGG